MAEYITIMVVNNKSPGMCCSSCSCPPRLTRATADINTELDDGEPHLHLHFSRSKMIYSDWLSFWCVAILFHVLVTHISPDPTFTEWVFAQAQSIGEESVASIEQLTSASETTNPSTTPATQARSPPTAESSGRRPQGHGRNGVFNQAMSQALPTSGQKRPASARSPSPGHSHKVRRTEPPTGPRAMGSQFDSPTPGPRSLLDRVGGPTRNTQNTAPETAMMAQMESMGASPEQAAMMNQMMAAGAFPPGMGGGMDMNAMGGMMGNPLMLQEMMMNQMAMMAQMASSMGILNPATGQFQNNGFPNQPQDGQQNGGFTNGRGRGSGRGVRGGRGRGGSSHVTGAVGQEPDTPHAIVAPTPTTSSSPAATFSLPERPQSPNLCKYGVKCTNAHCRWSHPSPVATTESGIVLSNEPCVNGKNCKDKDCVKSHVSPAVLNPQGDFTSCMRYFASLADLITAAQQPPNAAQQHPTGPKTVSCRFGATCTRPDCSFSHPTKPTPSQISQSCRYGAACTKAACPFKHPEGRVLPNSFHRGLAPSSPSVTIKAPETGSMGTASGPNKSVTFNKSEDVKGRLAKQIKDLEEQRKQLHEAEARAAVNKVEGVV